MVYLVRDLSDIILKKLKPNKVVLVFGARRVGKTLLEKEILATFGVSDAAVMDIITGKFNPTGKLPYALAKTSAAVVKQAPDAPGYPEEDTLFPFGFGLSYK